MLTKREKVHELLGRGVAEIVERESLEGKLAAGRKLRIKHGVDPTTADLHVGYAVVYEKLRQFQALGHTIVFLIGGFTARFGDPTDRTQVRTIRPKKDVEANAKRYLAQLGKILDTDKVELRSNAEWYDRMTAETLLSLLSRFTTQRMLERDMFVERMKAGKPIGLHEPVYPVLQGWDSVMIKSDATVIGTDQKFNELVGRNLQRQEGQAPQDLMMMPLLVGTDGKRKMSQSLGNDIKFSDSPNEMYGKVMSIPDEQIVTYLTLVTRMPLPAIADIERSLKKGANPRDAKARLAEEIVVIYHGTRAATNAAAEFERVFKERLAPSAIPTVKLRATRLSAIDLVVDVRLASSRSVAARLIEQGGVRVNEQVIKDRHETVAVKTGDVIRVGRRFVKIG